ncbi:hypothetical protein CDL15_Pgr027335 [Punica granatum]|uniref:Uncharacterized protein n=1 Tax=Punica granatum TaxID=22663 RepID=A0A218WD11_PUNGR|nr:hypothetical protein CDL15_Pgr027335 [Punica granatum]
MIGKGPRVEELDEDVQSEVSNQQQTKSTSPPKGNIVFTLDNILYSKWLNRLHEFLAYFSQGALVTQNNHDILADFVARFVEILRNWWTIMGEADKVYFLCQNLAEAIRLMHVAFIRNPDDLKELK